MSTFRTIRIDSLQELRRRSGAWNALWDRSGTELPLLRAEMLAVWVEQFSSARRFQAFVVERDGQLVAALPLVRRRLKGFLSAWALPSNEWSHNGDLLWDTSAGDEALSHLVHALGARIKSLLWLDGVDLETAPWRAFLSALKRADLPFEAREQYHLGLIDIPSDFEDLASRLPAGLRRNTRRRLRNLEKRGAVALRSLRELSPGQVEPTLRVAFEIEGQSWKSAAGTSVLQTPGMFEYFVRQCSLAAERGELFIDFLDVAGRPIAFELGYVAKGRQFAHKVSYIEEFAKEGPGNALRWLQLEGLAAAGDVRLFDYFGKMSEAAEQWSTSHYSASRLVVGSRRIASRAIFSLYRRLGAMYRHWRDKRSKPAASAAEAFNHAGDHAAKTRPADCPATQESVRD